MRLSTQPAHVVSLVACAMAEDYFKAGESDEGMIAYDAALQAQQRITHPLYFLQSVVACEHILREYLWRGDSDEL